MTTVTIDYLHAAEKAGRLGPKRQKLAQYSHHQGVVVLKDGAPVRTKRGNACLFATWEAAEAFIESRDDLRPHFDFSDSPLETATIGTIVSSIAELKHGSVL